MPSRGLLKFSTGSRLVGVVKRRRCNYSALCCKTTSFPRWLWAISRSREDDSRDRDCDRRPTTDDRRPTRLLHLQWIFRGDIGGSGSDFVSLYRFVEKGLAQSGKRWEVEGSIVVEARECQRHRRRGQQSLASEALFHGLALLFQDGASSTLFCRHLHRLPYSPYREGSLLYHSLPPSLSLWWMVCEWIEDSF